MKTATSYKSGRALKAKPRYHNFAHIVVTRKLHTLLKSYAFKRQLLLQEAVEQLLAKAIAQAEGWEIEKEE